MWFGLLPEGLLEVNNVALVVRSRGLVVVDVNFNLYVLGLVINFLQATDRTLGLIEQADGAVEAEHRVLGKQRWT